MDGEPLSQRLWKLRLWSLEARRYCPDLIEVYKMLRGKSVVNFNSLSELDGTGCTRRHSSKLKKKTDQLRFMSAFLLRKDYQNMNTVDDDFVH